MNHHSLTLEEVARVINVFGAEGFKVLSGRLPEANIKHGGRTLGQVEAFLNMIEPTDLNRLLQGEVLIRVEEVIRKLVDRNGRMIPLADMVSLRGVKVVDPNPCFKLFQPRINYDERLNRLRRFFPGFEFTDREFRWQSEELLEQLQRDPLLSNLPKGVWLPVCYPQFSFTDYGEVMENIFLKAVSESYEDYFPGRKFINFLKEELKGKVGVVEESHKRFLMEMAKRPLVGIQFFPFQGFSVEASRKLMAALPKSLLLSGPIDLVIAITAYPDVLVRDNYVPAYHGAAVSWKSSSYSIGFASDDDKLVFCDVGRLNYPNECVSAGLVYLG